MIARRFVLLVAIVLALGAAASAQPQASPDPVPVPTASAAATPGPARSPAPTPVPGPSGTAAAPVSTASALAAGPGLSIGLPDRAPQAYAAFVKSSERQSGAIDILKKDDDVYFDLGAAQFDRPFIIAPVLASGVGSEAFAGRVYPSFVMEFKRVGKRVLWIAKNSSFTAPAGTSAANALAISVTDSVINSTPIAAEDDAKKHVVVSANFFLTDFENVGKDLGGPQQPIILFGGPARPGFSVDATKSYIERTKALPRNDELLANLAFSGPPGDVSGAPDGRGLRLRMHYSIVAPAEGSAYVPRLADDRVGYFVTSQKRFDNDALSTPYVRYINRWNFANGPIVYYLTNEIPAQYKPAIRSALLKWNAAFARVGIPNAIEVRDQPADAGWDPDDVRYSTVRWITSDRSPFAAYGPHISDPRTGEIMRVEIVIDGEALRSVKRGYVDQVAPVRSLGYDASGLPVATGVTLACPDLEACDGYGETSAEFAAVGATALRAQGASPARSQAFADDWLLSVVLHESGHNFGLRHNFVAPSLYPLAALHDRAFTHAHGLAASVMGYAPTNLSRAGQPQGDYFQTQLGPYDYWAIRYGYAKFPNAVRTEDEAIPLRRIADENSRPEYAYATDEDANGPLAIDPRVATFALSNDPLAFDANQFAVVHDLVRRLDDVYPRDDRSYDEERQTFATMMRSYRRAALLATKYVGGIYTSRAHRGQPGGAPPLSPVPRAQSLRAFRLLADNVFSSRAMRFSPRLLADLGPSHFPRRGDAIERPDFPVESYVADVQDAVMFALFDPDTMSRLADEPYRVSDGTKTMRLDDLFTWMGGAVWDDLRPGAAIDPLHRGLQRRFTRLMIAYALAPSFVVESLGYPSDTAPLARYGLRRVAGRIDAALRSPGLDVATRAHLEDQQSRIRHALEPAAARGA